MDKLEKEIREEITNRLRFSDKKLWNLLSTEQKEAVVDKYYHARDIKNIGLNSVLENNRQMRKDLGFMILGLSLGIFSNLVINLVFKYLPKNSLLFDISIGAGFIILLVWTFKEFEKLSAEDLGNNKVLNYLLDQVEKDGLKI